MLRLARLVECFLEQSKIRFCDNSQGIISVDSGVDAKIFSAGGTFHRFLVENGQNPVFLLMEDKEVSRNPAIHFSLGTCVGLLDHLHAYTTPSRLPLRRRSRSSSPSASPLSTDPLWTALTYPMQW